MTAAVFATKLCMDDGSGCSELVPEFDSVHQGDKGQIRSREVTEDDKKCIHQALKEVQLSLSSQTGVIAHGLSDKVIDTIVSNDQSIFSVHNVIAQCNIPSLY